MSKPHYFTEKTNVTGIVQIWARTRSEWEREKAAENGDYNPFYYEIRTDAPYSDDATKIGEHEISLTVPQGIDLLAKTIETLKERKAKILADATRQAMELAEKINGLLMLAPPDPISGNKPSIEGICEDECFGADTINERLNANDEPF